MITKSNVHPRRNPELCDNAAVFTGQLIFTGTTFFKNIPPELPL